MYLNDTNDRKLLGYPAKKDITCLEDLGSIYVFQIFPLTYKTAFNAIYLLVI
jgi:hypothetical protein